MIIGDHDILEGDAPRWRCTQREFAFDWRRGQARRITGQYEACDLVIFTAYRPDDEHVCYWRVGDPHFFSLKHPFAVALARGGCHACGIGACPRLGQAEAPDVRAVDQFGQKFFVLIRGAIGVNWMQNQRVLHAECRTVPAINPFDMKCRHPIGVCAHAAAANCFGQGHAKQAMRAHLLEQLPHICRIACVAGKGLTHFRG